MEEKLLLYKIESDYVKYLHSIDNKVSVKYNNRPFVGIITMINGIKYVLPLTSQTTQLRKKAGKNKRSPRITTYIKDSSGEEIADILYNNMIPVKEGMYQALEIDARVDTYEANEVRYIRKNTEKIQKKAQKVYAERTVGDDAFLEKTCCDFKRLEQHYLKYGE